MPTKPIEFHDEAGVEYDVAFDWNLERNPDAALLFDAEVNRALADIAAAPHRWGRRLAFYSPILAPAISLHCDLSRARK